MAQKVLLRENKSNKELPATISKITNVNLPAWKDQPKLGLDWIFNWEQLLNTFSRNHFFSIEVNGEIQGLLHLSVDNGGITTLENIEISPVNVGKNGKYIGVARNLLGVALKFSYNLSSFQGYVFLQPKNKKLSEIYIKVYNAKFITSSSDRLYISGRVEDFIKEIR